MPIYEYRCKECHQIFEEWTKHIDDNAAQPCPVCGTSSERVISNTSFVLKGGGWYVTDYGYKSKQAGQEATAASPSGSSAPSGATPAAAPAFAPPAAAAGSGGSAQAQ